MRRRWRGSTFRFRRAKVSSRLKRHLVWTGVCAAEKERPRDGFRAEVDPASRQGIEDEIANVLVAQLLYLANEDPAKDITLYINSPGGSVSAGMAIYDTMQYVPCDVSTVCFGMAASMWERSSSAPAPRASAGPSPTAAS